MVVKSMNEALETLRKMSVIFFFLIDLDLSLATRYWKCPKCELTGSWHSAITCPRDYRFVGVH